jgi:tRNA-dihydrouridine synthase
VFIKNDYKEEVTIQKLKECAQDGSTDVVSIFGKAWRNPGLKNPLCRFRKHLKEVHGLSKEELPNALSMDNQSTGLTDNKNNLRAYKSKWRQMRQLKIKECTKAYAQQAAAAEAAEEGNTSA